MNRAIRWELSCVAAELFVAAIGLWLMLEADLPELASLVMFGLCALSFAIRVRYYSAAA
jgi:hypothetical protein